MSLTFKTEVVPAKRITARSALIAGGYRRKVNKVLAEFGGRTDNIGGVTMDQE